MSERTGLDPRLITECMRSLHRNPAQVQSWHRIHTGASGSGVFRLTLRGSPPQEAVLKVTTAAEGQAHALHELRFYTEIAEHLSMPTPTVLGTAEQGERTCLLLSAAQPAPPPASWAWDSWANVAAQLGRLHGRATMGLVAGITWLEPAWSPEPAQAAMDSALAYWTTVDHAGLARPLLGTRC